MPKPYHRVSIPHSETMASLALEDQKSESRKSRRRSARRFSKRKRFLMGAAIVVVIIALVGYLWGRSYLRSEAFRLNLNQQVSGLLGVEGEFAQLVWKSGSVETASFLGTGKGGVNQTVEGIDANQISIVLDWSSVWKDTFQMSQLQIHSLTIQLSDHQKKKREDREQAIGQNVDKKSSERTSPAWCQKFFAREVALSDARIDRLSVDYIAADGKEFSIENSQVEVEFFDREISVEMQGGVLELEYALLNEVVLDTAKWNYRENDVYIQSLQATVYDEAQLDLSGKIDEVGEAYELYGTLLGARCRHFLPDSWLSRLEGEMAVRFYVERGGVRSRESSTVRGELKVRNGVLKGLPILDQIAAYSETRGFQTIRFSKFQCEFQARENRLEIRNVLLHCDGLMRIEGDLLIEDRKLDGQFQLGVVPGVLRYIPGAEQKIFFPGKDHLLWAPVQISGTLENMKEDLSERMLLAAGMRMFETIPETGLQVLRFTGQGIEGMVLPESFEPLSELLDATGLDGMKSNFSSKNSSQAPLGKEFLSAPAEIIEGSQNLLESGLGGLGDFGGLFKSTPTEPKKNRDNE